MTDQPDPRPLSDVDLLVWAVVLGYRDRQQRDGITVLLLPFPPCPTCGETVHKAVASWVREPFREDVTIDVQPCGHAHRAIQSDIERIHEHALAMLDQIRADSERPAGESSWNTGRIISEARARVGEPERWCCEGNAEDCPLCDTAAMPYPWICPGHPDTGENRQCVQAAAEATKPAAWRQLEAHAFNAVQPHLAAHYQHAVDAAVAADQRATQAEAKLARVREVAALIRQGAPWTANHDAIADRIEAALQESTPSAASAQAATEREQRLVDAHQATIGQLRAAEARVRALEAEKAKLARYREWLADQLAGAEARDRATGKVPAELRISPHNGIASGLRTALYGLDQIAGQGEQP